MLNIGVSFLFEFVGLRRGVVFVLRPMSWLDDYLVATDNQPMGHVSYTYIYKYNKINKSSG